MSDTTSLFITCVTQRWEHERTSLPDVRPDWIWFAALTDVKVKSLRTAVRHTLTPNVAAVVVRSLPCCVKSLQKKERQSILDQIYWQMLWKPEKLYIRIKYFKYVGIPCRSINAPWCKIILIIRSEKHNFRIFQAGQSFSYDC